jgi:hypothetical protein
VCSKEYSKAWYEENRKDRIAYISAWKVSNPEKVKRYNQITKERKEAKARELMKDD